MASFPVRRFDDLYTEATDLDIIATENGMNWRYFGDFTPEMDVVLTEKGEEKFGDSRTDPTSEGEYLVKFNGTVVQNDGREGGWKFIGRMLNPHKIPTGEVSQNYFTSSENVKVNTDPAMSKNELQIELYLQDLGYNSAERAAEVTESAYRTMEQGFENWAIKHTDLDLLTPEPADD